MSVGRLPGIVIPAYRPGPGLDALVQALLRDDYPRIVVVDDGSGASFRPLFEQLGGLSRVEVVRHLVNLGKGEALKTGLNQLFVQDPDLPGAVTVDADGQHLPADVKKVARALTRHPDCLCLGARSFKGQVPWKSRIGNALSRRVLSLLSGQRLRDTQTGLRGIPRDFVTDLLPLRAAGYEFELEMLLRASERGLPLLEVPIETVYHDDNRESHFDAVWDSLRVYFVFLRFLVSSLLTAILDFATFSIAYALGGSILTSAALGRLFAGTFNFLVNQRVVFKAGRRPLFEAAKYVALVLSLMLVSYALILTLVERFGVNVFLAKLVVEGSFFLVSFAVQRVFVFATGGERPGDSNETDWDAYYERPGRAAQLTRRITTRSLLDCLRLHRGVDVHVLELGGGNSCFYDTVCDQLGPSRYTIVDNNSTGLALFERRRGSRPGVQLVHADVRELTDELPLVDITFSVGLIEHFDEAGTRDVIDAHFAYTRPGGLVVIFFPTPTWLYRGTRWLLEALGIWAFPDERPLPMAEVLHQMAPRGRVLDSGTNWSVVLTQGRVAVEVARGS